MQQHLASGFVIDREIARMSINFSGTRLGPWKQDGKDKREGMWEDRADSMFGERVGKKKPRVRKTERTVTTGRATDTALKGMQGNFTVVVQKYLLLTRRVMTDDSLKKKNNQSGLGRLERKEQLSVVAGEAGWADLTFSSEAFAPNTYKTF